MAMNIVVFVLLIVLLFFFPAAAIVSVVRQRKRKRAGSQIWALDACPANGNLSLKHGFEITTKNKWSRVQTTFVLKRDASANAPKLHWYTIALSDAKGMLLYTEQRSMADFFYFSWQMRAAKMKKESDLSTCEITLLEFVPPDPGQYVLGFTIKAREPSSEIKDLRVAVVEGVWPCRNRPYRHTCIDLRKQSQFKAGGQDIAE
jgi:hypothetical protein